MKLRFGVFLIPDQGPRTKSCIQGVVARILKSHVDGEPEALNVFPEVRALETCTCLVRNASMRNNWDYLTKVTTKKDNIASKWNLIVH